MFDIYRFTIHTWLSQYHINLCKILFLSRMGALMGGGVGLTIGFIFGSYSILRYAHCFHPIPHPHFGYLRSHIRTKGWCRPSRLPCHPLAVHAQQRCDILVLPCYRIGANEFLTPPLLGFTLNEASIYACPWLTRFLGYSKRRCPATAS